MKEKKDIKPFDENDVASDIWFFESTFTGQEVIHKSKESNMNPDYWESCNTGIESKLPEIRRCFIEIDPPKQPSKLEMTYLKNRSKIAIVSFVTFVAGLGIASSIGWITENERVKVEQKQVPSTTIQRKSNVEEVDPSKNKRATNQT